MIHRSEHDQDAEIADILAGQVPPEWALGTLLCRTDPEARMKRRWIYAGSVPDGCQRRLVRGGTIRKLDFKCNDPKVSVSYRCMPGRDPLYAGDTADVILYPCDWCSAAVFCDGFNVAWLNQPATEFVHLVTIFGGLLKGALDVLAYAEAVRSAPHRAETVILVDPDMLDLLVDVPIASLRR